MVLIDVVSMCIVALAWQLVADQPVVLLGNRDEFYHREALPLHVWADQKIIAGQDVSSQGTWLGINTTGQWAVITNFREGQPDQHHERSRGLIIRDYLNATVPLSPMQFARQLNSQQGYAGFNIIVGDLQQAVLLSNRGTAPTALASGLYTLSNGVMSDEWDKMQRLRLKVMQEFLPLLQAHGELQPLSDVQLNAAWQVLQNTQQADDHKLPQTGISMEMEKMLSSIFIQSPIYGTRVSHVLRLTQAGYEFIEKTHVPTTQPAVVKQVGQWHRK